MGFFLQGGGEEVGMCSSNFVPPRNDNFYLAWHVSHEQTIPNATAKG